MRSNHKFPVFIITKIPFISGFIAFLFCGCLLIAALAWILYLPSDGNEMQTVVLLETTPEPTKWAMVVALIALFPLYFLHQRLRIRKPAFLLFNDGDISMMNNAAVKIFPLPGIVRIQFRERSLPFQSWKRKLLITIYLRDLQSLEFQVKHYEHSEEIADCLLSYDELKYRLFETGNTIADDTMLD